VKDRGQKTRYREQYSAPGLDQNGSAIIITVLIVSILVALVVEFAYEVYIDTAALSNWTNAQKASLVAKSGQTLCSEYISEYINMMKENNTQSEVERPVERDLGPNTQLTLKIEDENAKFNINSIIFEKNGKPNERNLDCLKRLFKYLNINPRLAMIIADWIDPDSEPGEGLSDSEVNVKNAYLSTVEELKLIQGVDKSTYDKIIPFITVHGNRLININTAKLPVLMSLDDDMSEPVAQRIIDYRETTPFENTADIVRVQGMEKIGQTLQCDLKWGCVITAKCGNFKIISEATVNEITRIIESVMDTSGKIQFWREQ